MIWIRADANREIGAGHVMRCLAIAVALKKQGESVCFLTADESAGALLRAKGQEYRVLGSDYRCLEEELGILEKILPNQGQCFFLADSYFVTEEYFRKVKEWMPVGYLDDKGSSCFHVDLLTNYNIFAEPSLYGQCPGTRFLLGTEYAPLREEFMECPYQVRDRAERVLVTTGGSDRYDLAGQLLRKALARPETAKLEYCVISGAYNVHLEGLKSLAEGHPNVRIYSNVSNMRELMQDSDIAVTAGGSTMYELCAVGVPIICFSFVDNQERIVEGFGRRGLVDFAGNYLSQGEAMLDQAVERIGHLAGDKALRQRYSRQARTVVDGRGAARIAEEIIRMRSGL